MYVSQDMCTPIDMYGIPKTCILAKAGAWYKMAPYGLCVSLQGNGEIKLYDYEAQKVASILKKSRNPNLFDGHTNKGRKEDE